ncbi:MAG: cutinase [Mycobacterium sp.]|jgi:cutinase|nr:cutinase [Mycobacterium sp.]
MGCVTFSRISAAVATALVSAASLLVAGQLPSASAAECPNVEVVFARGTGEPAGIGRVGQAFVDALQGLVPSKTVTSFAVDYPADYDFLNAASGAQAAEAHIRATSQQCPSTKFVLGGYSQGAAVMDMLIGIPPLGRKIGAVGDKFGDIGSAAPLSPDLAGSIAAIAVFGNPSTKFSIPATAAPAPYGGRAIDSCKDGDPICSRGRNPFAHSGYESSEFIQQSAAFVANFV